MTIAYVDSDIAGNRVGENNTQLFAWHGRGDDKAIFPIVSSIVDTTILSIVNSLSIGSGFPGCGPDLEPDQMVEYSLLSGKQRFPPCSGTGWNRTVVPY
jgi:hypothetical protein